MYAITAWNFSIDTIHLTTQEQLSSNPLRPQIETFTTDK